MDFPDEVFTSATVVKDSMMPPHKDVFNDKNTNNLVSPLTVPKGAGVWQEMIQGDEFFGCYQQREVKGKELPGQFFSLQKPVRVHPRRYHAPVQGEEGARVVVAGHTIGSWRKLNGEMVTQLEDCGFVLPQEAEQPSIKAVTAEFSDDDECDYEMDEENVIEDFVSKEPTVEAQQEILMARKAALENLYTYNIEKVLQELDGELRVVHTVHQSEVEANLSEWVESLKDEVEALENMKAIRRRRGQDAKEYLAQAGVTVVPGKGVFTVKPPSKPGKRFRRKSRIVSCGNFQPKDNAELNYSGGAASDAVRLGVAEASRRSWQICTGDVCNAFLRAPVPEGTKLALRPPGVLLRAGLAEPGEVWEVLTALYGFRTSPRWWSTYRTKTMKEGRTEGGLSFHQGVADADTWQVKNDQGHIVGLVIVYVDDYLIAANHETCLDIHEWFSTTWQTTPCQFASKDSPVRFLGMEIRTSEDVNGKFDGYTLDQEGYIDELLRARGVGDHERSLLPSSKEWMSLEPESFPGEYTAEDLKEAQSRTGELSWLCQRTRPDISYTVNIMSSLVTRDPVRASMIGKKCLAYVNHTKDWRLHYRPGGGRGLTTYTDSSYAPEGGRSHGGAVTFWSSSPIAWKRVPVRRWLPQAQPRLSWWRPTMGPSRWSL